MRKPVLLATDLSVRVSLFYSSLYNCRDSDSCKNLFDSSYSAYALNFTKVWFGSLFGLQRVPILLKFGSQFPSSFFAKIRALDGRKDGQNSSFSLKKNKLCGFTPEWVSNQIFKSPSWLNDLLHCKQLCAFSPEWVSKCLFKVPASVNDLLHCAQLCDFSPVWVIKCLVKCWDCLNDLLHCEYVDLCGCFSHFGRTENGILGPLIKILRPLFTLQLLILPTGDSFHAQKS